MHDKNENNTERSIDKLVDRNKKARKGKIQTQIRKPIDIKSLASNQSINENDYPSEDPIKVTECVSPASITSLSMLLFEIIEVTLTNQYLLGLFS